MPNAAPLHFRPCRNIVNNNGCDNANCPYQHRLFTCALCRSYMTSQGTLRAHLKGKRHAKSLQQAQQEPGPDPNGRPASSSSPAPAPASDGPGWCDACRSHVPDMARHLTTPKHERILRFLQYQRAKTETEADKNGVRVSPAELDFGLVDEATLGQGPAASQTLCVEATDEVGAGAILLGVKMMSTRDRVVSLFNATFESSVLIQQDTLYELKVVFDAPAGVSGRHLDTLELIFARASSPRERFKICRPIKAIVTDPEVFHATQPKGPYVRRARRIRVRLEDNYVPGVRPESLTAIEWVEGLPQYKLKQFIVERMTDESDLGDRANWAKDQLTGHRLEAETYGKYWQGTLWIEEVQMQEDIRTYDMEKVSFRWITARASRRYLELDVPGLAENRPSVLIGDYILARPAGTTETQFQGYVHNVLQTKVHLKFDSSFDPLGGELFDVQFTVNRLPLRRMHHVLSTPLPQPRAFFPSRPDNLARPSANRAEPLRFFDRRLEINEAQSLAVASIMGMKDLGMPFIVFGPPGTGKTSVVVEAVKQLCERAENTRVLLCAPSNSAADLLAMRIMVLYPKHKILRMYAASRSPGLMPKELAPISRKNEHNTFYIPPLPDIMACKVVVCTCISAAALRGVGVPKGHYTHVFVDEAGQAMEPEVAIPLVSLSNATTQLVLAGDPRQLGPIVRSPVAIDLKLGISLLGRLMGLPAYNEKEFGGKTIVKLIRNYRNHPSILKFPNEEFYRGELLACADPVVTHSLLRWDMLANPNMPCLMQNVPGEDMQEAGSPSFFNPLEVAEVKRYICSLLEDNRKFRVTQRDIGVISPYNAQVLKIRAALRQKYPDVKVGSVEEFQGQERRVIIMSTVRSNKKYLRHDSRFSLGFVANDRRFNVAVTRAQAALVVIGDARLLRFDSTWRRFMNYLHTNGCWKGQMPEWNTSTSTLESAPGVASTSAAPFGAVVAAAELAAPYDRLEALIASLGDVALSDDGSDEYDPAEGARDLDWRELD